MRKTGEGKTYQDAIHHLTPLKWFIKIRYKHNEKHQFDISDSIC